MLTVRGPGLAILAPPTTQNSACQLAFVIGVCRKWLLDSCVRNNRKFIMNDLCSKQTLIAVT